MKLSKIYMQLFLAIISGVVAFNANAQATPWAPSYTLAGRFIEYLAKAPLDNPSFTQTFQFILGEDQSFSASIESLIPNFSAVLSSGTSFSSLTNSVNFNHPSQSIYSTPATVSGSTHYALTVSGTPSTNLRSFQATLTGTGLIPVAIPAVPEPESYVLMLAGLGLIGAVARRRKLRLAEVH